MEENVDLDEEPDQIEKYLSDTFSKQSADIFDPENSDTSSLKKMYSLKM